jgi:hypothetical protein
MNEPLVLDVFVQGAGVRRDIEVEPLDAGLRVGDRTVPWREVLWVSRRSGMMLVFTAHANLAIQAAGKQLTQVEDWLESRVDQTELRRRLVRQLGHEVVLFSAGCAVDGRLEGTRLRGLFLAAATRRALYLLSGGGQYTIEWPVDRVKRQLARPGEIGGDGLLLSRGDDEVLLRYLFPEEVVALATACRKQPPLRSGDGPTLELFSRKEVSPPPPAELPQFSVAAGALHEVAGRAAANVPGELHARAGLAPDFFENHFLELGEIALGPLILRKSAASTAGSLRKAAEAMDADGLREDTQAAVAAAAERMLGVFSAEAARIAAERGVSLTDPEGDTGMDDEAREALVERMQAPFARLWMRFEGLDQQGAELIELLGAYEDGPPGDDDRVDEAADEWRATLSRLDAGYVGAWRELVEEIEKTWSTDLLPRLVRIASREREGLPEWVQLAGLGVLTLLLVLALVFFFVV